MIETLYGRIYEVSTAASTVIVECNGVGYRVTVSANTASQLPRPQFAPDGTALAGDPIRIFTHMSVREDAVELFGFYTREELDMFRLLIGVSGVGPKAAQAILSSNTPEGLALAIVSGNEKALTLVPGIGKKIAQRVILELKDKLGKDLSGTGMESITVPAAEPGGGKRADAAAALGVLGYSNSEIAAALKGLDLQNMSVEEIIKAALRSMMK